MPGLPPSPDDPFDAALRPPPGETPGERELRLAREDEALKISMAIDANIKAERLARKKKRVVRLLLLGQSESGEFEGTCIYARNLTEECRKIYHLTA